MKAVVTHSSHRAWNVERCGRCCLRIGHQRRHVFGIENATDSTVFGIKRTTGIAFQTGESSKNIVGNVSEITSDINACNSTASIESPSANADKRIRKL